MADLQRMRRTLTEATAERDRLTAELALTASELAAERDRLAALRASGDRPAADAAEARIGVLAGRRAESAQAIGALNERVRAQIEPLLGDGLRLEGNVPLVLLPVRVETRYTADGARLRVRIFHDALHTESLEEGLSDTERQAGTAYWTAVWDGADATGPWPALVAAVGSLRAPWVAEALRPVNLASRPGPPPRFPDPPPLAGRPAVARTLPDRFFVRVEQDGAAPQTVAGRAIPDELPVGLTGRDEFAALRLDGEDLPPIDESLRWLVDYDEAERVGMAVTVELPLPGRPVRRLVAYGVRAALDPIAGPARLERLIRSHRYTDGAEFVAQGTPTNNTDSVRTEWSRRTPPGPPDLAPPASLDGFANAAVTAAAFGVEAAGLATLPNAGDREQARAAAFNTALWTTTWGEAIEHLTPAGRANGDQRLDAPALDAVRDHWVDHVRGRGPLPVLRLGRQPYGLLPVVATDTSWRPRGAGFVENRLVPFIDRQVRWMWDDALPAAPTVMNRPLGEALPQILGTDAVLRGLRVRTALSPDPVIKGAMGLLLPDLGDTAAGGQVTKALLLLAGVADDAVDDHDLLGTKTRTLALPLVHESDGAFVTGLLAPVPPPMQARSVLQVLLALAGAVERHRDATLAPRDLHGLLREAVVSTRVDVDRDLVVTALDGLLDGDGLGGGLGGGFDDRVGAAAEHVTDRVGRLDPRMVADRNPIPAIAPESMVQQVVGGRPTLDRLRDTMGMRLVGEIFHRSRWTARFRAALETIAGIESIDERRLLLAESLDCCSHRLDAWITAAASRRLRDLRAGGAAGAFLGAYGWVENIEPRTPVPAGQVDGLDVLRAPGDGGYVHAPSLAHAATAGILRSGRLTHRRGDPGSEPLDIDLSSARTRDALALLDGMRQGRQLGALLGYRLERRLHERSGGGLELDRFIYVLRTLAPLRGGKLTEPGAAVQESLAASDVVDGLRLLEIPPAVVTQKLQDGPADARYIEPPDQWLPPRPGEAEAVLTAIAELQHTHDAVADLLLAESVHQLAAGNPARAAAALDALGAGEAMPPDPDVVRTPRSGVPIQHKIAIVISDSAPGAAVPGWNPAAPRAVAEPRLEAWARSALADPAVIRLSADAAVTLADAGLAALDVLYDADGDAVGASTLASRLRRIFPGETLGDLALLAPVWELAGMLRAVVLAGRPFDSEDLGRPVGEGSQGRRPDVAELLSRARNAADGLQAAIAMADPVTELARFGVRPPGPSAAAPALTAAEQAAARDALVSEATARLSSAQALLDRAAEDGSAKSTAELAAQALAAVFGGGFVALALWSPPPADQTDPWAGAVGSAGVRARPGADIRPWLARAGALRTAASAFGEILLVREAAGDRPLLRVVQSPAGAFSTWAGLPFPEGRPPSVPLTAMVAEIAGARAGEPEPRLSGVVAGVVVDEWTEVVPRRLERHDPNTPEAPPVLEDVTTTGLAVHANAPGARPPQAVLIALSPDGGDWDGDRLVHLLDETHALARMRTLTLQQIPYLGRYLPALYFRDWSLQGEPAIDWSRVAAEYHDDNVVKYLRADR